MNFTYDLKTLNFQRFFHETLYNYKPSLDNVQRKETTFFSNSDVIMSLCIFHIVISLSQGLLLIIVRSHVKNEVTILCQEALKLLILFMDVS